MHPLNLSSLSILHYSTYGPAKKAEAFRVVSHYLHCKLNELNAEENPS